MNPVIRSVSITPEFARKQIKKLHPELYKDQNIDFEKCEQFRQLMESGRWIANQNNEPIAINLKGELLNGLHRLVAISFCRIAICEVIAFGVPDFKYGQFGNVEIKNHCRFVECCAELMLDIVGACTRSKATLGIIHNAIYDKVKRLTQETKADRKIAAFVVAALCCNFEVDAKLLFSINCKLQTPENLSKQIYAVLNNIKTEVFSMPIDKVLRGYLNA